MILDDRFYEVIQKNLFILLVFIIIAVFFQVKMRKQGVDYNEEFIQSTINGVITKKVHSGTGGTRIEVDGESYTFSPYTGDLNNGEIFSYIAFIGDSIQKKSYGDTLFLIKRNGQVFKYTFNSRLD